MDRVQTGIKGFDELIEGGFPYGSTVLVSGTPGTGKTIFGMEYLYRGMEQGQKGLYVSFEESKANLMRQASNFGWDLQKCHDEGNIFLHCIPIHSVERSTPDDILKLVEHKGVHRVVIDSLSTLTMNTPTLTDHPHTIDALAVKRFIYGFLHKLAKADSTVLVVSHCRNDESLSIDGVSEFVCDGIVKIHSQSIGGEYSRSLIVAKMRSTRNNDDVHPLEISDQGLVVHNI